MSMGMMVYLVDEAEVKAVPGSGNEELLADLLEREGQRESLSWFDEELEHIIEDQCPGFTHADALRDLFAGQVSRPDAGFVYANAFEHVCSSLGEWVQNRFSRCSASAVERLDHLFEAHGIGLRFYGGLVTNPPVPLPDDPDGPGMGHWTRAEILAAAPAFRTLLAADPDPEMRLLLAEVGEWVSKVEAKPGSMLVAVFS